MRTRYLMHAARTLAAAGVSVLQYRNKLGTDEEVLEDATLLRRTSPPALRILLNDRAHLVAACGCDGVHVGQGDLPVEQARALVGLSRLVGLSTHTAEQVQQGDATSADYLAIGPVYPTVSKRDAEPAVGLAGVARARSLTAKPLVAIGGITVARAAELRAAGADAIAVISALFGGAAGADWSEETSPLRKLAGDFLHTFR